MYSFFPALISSLFLGYGVFIACTQGFTAIGTSFFILCITSAIWQGTWAVLFQVQDPHITFFLVKFGYLLILFLPTSLYHFLVEVSHRGRERRYVYISYGVAAALALVLLGSNQFVTGYYHYFFGPYPKAGMLHPLHVLQTVVVVMRGLYVTYRQQQHVNEFKRAKLRMCIGAVLIYFFAAVDYLCNYGIEFYPPGVVFMAISLSLFTIAIVRYNLMNPFIKMEVIVATLAHEMQNPLSAIKGYAEVISAHLPVLRDTYHLAVSHGLHPDSIDDFSFELLASAPEKIDRSISQSALTINMLLTASKKFNTDTFHIHSINHCIIDVLNEFPFSVKERELVFYDENIYFQFYGSDTLLSMVLFNLLKNALYAIKLAGKGEIKITTVFTPTVNRLCFTDTGIGIERNALTKVFEPFFTTKESGGNGVGLAFCRRVMTSFGGRILCESVPGKFTTFTLEFPVLKNKNDGIDVAPMSDQMASPGRGRTKGGGIRFHNLTLSSRQLPSITA